MYKEIIKRLIRAAGFELHRITPATNPTVQLMSGLKRFGVDLVLDVGANIGQFSSELRAHGYEGDIVSFEPLSTAHRTLVAAAAGDPAWQVFSRCAIGDHEGETKINISGNSYSSSILPMMPLHSEAASNSAYVSQENVPIRRLDSLELPVERYSRPFLKIDTQGYEWKVLDGARGILPGISGVLCELSLVPLYDGQRLWMDVIERLQGEGFTLWALQRGFTDSRDGRTLQVDAIFFRT